MTVEAAPPRPSAYRYYVLGVLLLIYTSNFVDRMILGVLGQPIKADLGLSDLQLGLLGGTAFALLYATLGMPIARVAERTKRVNVVTVALTVWSGMTALCGVAGNYWQLLLVRVGVGVGEAGCVPPLASLISDYFPPRQRGTAGAIFSLGIPIGTVVGVLVGGLAAKAYGWRAAFFVVGLPGLLLAILFRLTVKEPPRGAFDADHDSQPAPPMMAVVRRLFAKPTFVHVALGSAISSFAAYGITTFVVSHLMRGFSLDIVQAGIAFALFGGAAAAAGILLGGFVTDWAGKRDPRLYTLIPAAGFILAAPLYMAAFLQPTLAGLAAFVIAPAVLQYIYIGPGPALCQNMAGPRERAIASALLTLIINLIGMGLGPPAIGWASDLFAQAAYSGAGDFLAVCPGGKALPGADAAAVAACGAAAFTGLQRALVMSGAIFLWAGLHFVLAARTVKADLEV